MQVSEVTLASRRAVGLGDAVSEERREGRRAETMGGDQRRGGATGQDADAPGRNSPDVAPVREVAPVRRGGGASGRRLLAMGISVATKVLGYLAQKKHPPRRTLQ